MSTMEDILATQQQILDAMVQMYTNFKKDSAERKTSDYIRKRVETIDKYWQEFQENHSKLSKIEFAKTHSYFTSEQYSLVKEKYDNIRAAFKNYQVQEDRPSTPILKPATLISNPGPSRQPSPQISMLQSQGTNSKTDEMLRKQSSNFKALEHTLSNINLESISEKWEFDHILRTIQSRWSNIDALHWELDSELGGRNLTYEVAFSNYETKYNDIIKSINRKLWSVSHKDQLTPHVEIPTFSGNYHQWSSFKDLFIETIHGNPSLSNAQKMQFLKTKVRGEAERLIQHLPITSDNYTISWDILNNRYNNKRLIFRSHIEILLNIPVVQQISLNHIKRIHDTTLETLNAIKNLGVDVESWDPLLVHLLSQKLDAETHNNYLTACKNPRELPSLQEFISFLESTFTSLESSRKKPENYHTSKTTYHTNNYLPHQSNKYHKNFHKQSFPANNRFISQHPNIKNNISTKFYKCAICKSNEHCLYYCKEFLNMTPYLKRRTLSKYNVCENCLYSHNGKQCISEKRCLECNAAHNTILHEAFTQSGQTNNFNAAKATTSGNGSKPDSSQRMQSNSHVSVQRDMPEILLATAMLKVQKCDGTFVNMRALIDQGSQTSLITERAAQILGHPRLKCRGVISGVGTKASNCKGLISIKCGSKTSDFEFETEVYIMKNLIKNLPNYTFSKPSWAHLDNINLADPEFYISRPVDILFGADIYSLILLEGICRPDNNIPLAQNTRLGWILTGNVKTLQCNIVINNLEEIQKFWEIEDINEESTLSAGNQHCIDYYRSTTTRREDGSYQVRLPMIPDFQDQLGESKYKAIAQFRSLEHKLNKQTNIEKQYKLFMNEFRALGHMIPVLGNSRIEYFNTHHCVHSDDIMNCKFRVVFNASSKTSSGKSLNDVMECGPNLQQDLQSLIIKWRQFRFGFTADIEKMFRQIWVHPDDQKLLKIIWRDSTLEPIKEYQMTRVTYGLKCSPFLAMMTLKQLANDEKANYRDSKAIDVLNTSFYMDDLVYGCHTLDSAKKLQSDLIKLLNSGGFHLRKWKSNTSELLKDVDAEQNSQDDFSFKSTEETKTLGLVWKPQQDMFTFESKWEQKEITNNVTKRSLLSDISKLFDPLGWLAPISTKLKIIFQQVWAANIKWDDRVPDHIYFEWIKIREDMINIKNLQIPRWMHTDEGDSIELHGFCDSSLKAYACVIYCRIHKEDRSSVVLLASKTRLVPTSKTVTLPRLELSGALLLSRLMSKVIKCLQGLNIKTYGWVDSMVVLGWLNGEPTRWKTFVANRVKEITQIMPRDGWRYVKSEENPADCASRGLTVSQLKVHNLWWQGPTWLSHFNDNNTKIVYSTDQELKLSKQVYSVMQQQNYSIIETILSNYSSFRKAVRVVAWIRRFINKNKEKYRSYLSVNELKQSTIFIIKKSQQNIYYKEVADLMSGNKIHSKSKICELHPYLDQSGLLRVGGRLRHANLDPDTKNPIIIPNNSRLTELLIDQSHNMTFHGGARLTSAHLRQKYWIVGGNRAVKKRLRSCIQCRRQEPSKHCQIMGDLPSARANPSRPFYHVAVDYTGHVFIKANAGRGIKTSKGYIAVFTCMATKAVHLELVSNLTSSAFLAALRRMSARRGTPHHIYSDNGTNFVGANKVLQREYEELLKVFNEDFKSEVAEMGIKWHFNAPSWPSANGLCEAAVKSLKYHLKRVVGEQKLTYEEFSTLLTQIEACLNSRPLCPLTEDVEDLNYLTPSHFLSSGPVLSIYETENDLRTRWHLTQKIFQDIWKRWQQEYLTSLSARSRWRQPQENIKVGDIVIINDGHLPPGKWVLGRVMELHPGNDGYVRVVTLKTKSGYIKRPIIKLSILPIKQEENQSKNQKSTSQNQERKPERSRNATKKFNFSIVATCMMLFFMTLIINTQGIIQYNTTSISNNRGLYFDRMATMHLIQDEWRLIVYYDTNPYWEGIKASNKYIKYLQAICEKISVHSLCDGVLYQLNHRYSELENYNSRWLNQQNTAHAHRIRRGLINGVGNIAHSLFGILDNDFAEKYEQDIMKIRENQNHLAQLWKNQTSVVEAEFNLIKRAEFIMEKNHKIVNKKLMDLAGSINNVKSELQTSSYINEFTLSAIITNNMLYDLKHIQDELLNTLTDVFHGKYDVHLFHPEQLQQELSVISAKLPKDLSLPTDHVNLSKLYKILRIKARLSEKFLIFEVRIPLIARDSYEMFQVTAIPKQSGNNMISIVPISKYIALNLNKDLFLSVAENDLQTCFEQDFQTLLCHFKKPIYHMKSDQTLCEKGSANICKTITEPCKNILLQTNTVNTYLYFYCNTSHFRLLCDDHITAIQLSHTGLLTVGQGCIIKTADYIYHSSSQYMSKLGLKTDLAVPEIAPINHIINISFPESPASTSSEKVDQKQLLDIQNQLDDMKRNQPLIEGISYHDIHHYSLIYLVVAVVAVVGAVGGWRRIRRARRRESAGGSGPAVISDSDVGGVSEMPNQHLKCQSGEVISESMLTSARKIRQNRGTSPVLQSVFTIDTGV